MTVRIHPSAVVSEKAEIGDGTQIWLHCQVRDSVRIGKHCILGKNVYVDSEVTVGDAVKIQNNVSIYAGVTIEDGVFVGPHVCFTNDKVPRAVNPDMTLKSADDWTITKTLIKAGAALGANATIVCGVTVGKWAMVGSGAVVTKDVPDHALVLGNPARVVGWVCACGKRVEINERDGSAKGNCSGTCACGRVLVRDAASAVRMA
jgi:UDP-2-acetamido-3-amino-2,3-dideoxy-glucuronate N-acetyltransferase